MADANELICCHELTQVKARYCRGLDAKDWGLPADLLTDGQWQVASFRLANSIMDFA